MDNFWPLSLPITIIMTVSTVIGLFACVCGCKAKKLKDELVGLEGHVKIRNPESCDVREIDIVDGNTATAKRSLPDLPIDDALEIAWEPVGDASSDLYATVGVQKNQKLNRSETYLVSPTSQEHPYDRLKKVEHPYAQLNQVDSPSASSLLPPIEYDVQMPNRTEALEPIHRDIHAAPAIAGHVSATDDLPYITPPTHFSGDSQDSAKGYTSISVREPLSEILKETQQMNARPYATVSDDSDDNMYAAIEEQTSGSETYAQIRPPGSKEANSSAAGKVVAVSAVIEGHSRQASSSSAASSSIIVGSPKPEKRPANSPLPAPPLSSSEISISSTTPLEPLSEDFYTKLHFSENPQQQSVDDMYAKVNKKRPADGPLVASPVLSNTSSPSNSCSSCSGHSRCSQACHGHSTTTASTSTSTTDRRINGSLVGDAAESVFRGEERDEKEEEDACYDSLNGVPDQPCYETLTKKRKDATDPGYETLGGKGPPSDSDPNYEKIKDHDYASIHFRKNSMHNGSDLELDHNFLSVEKPVKDVYAVVNKKGRDCSERSEPPYESLKLESSEPNYESVQFSQESDPPYQLLAECGSGLPDDKRVV